MQEWMKQMNSGFERMEQRMIPETDTAVDIHNTVMEKLRQMEDFYQEHADDILLYRMAVGIERMEKVLLLLMNNMEESDSTQLIREQTMFHHQESGNLADYFR